jgi:hypothetical protein
MPDKNSRWNPVAYAFVLLAEAAYAVLTIMAPRNPSQNALGLTPFELMLLQLTIVVPYMVAWLAGTRGALGFRSCGAVIPEDEGGRGFRAFGYGVAMLVAGSLLTALIGACRSYAAPGSSAVVAVTIVNNYVYVLTSLLAYVFLFRGAGRLVGKAENRAYGRDDLLMAVILGIVIAGLYAPLVYTNPARQVPVDPGSVATYYLPDALIALTIILPFAVAWTLGFMTAMRIARYAPPGRDPRQKKAVREFVNGLWMTLFSSILLQLLVSIGTDRLLALGLGSILALIYAFIILQIAGFVLISAGSNRFCRFDEPARRLEVKAVL